MRPLSYVRAKPAMPVAGEPLVRRILRGLARAGVTRTVLNLHHLPETVCAAVGDPRDLGLSVRYSHEDPVLGSAGGPRRALPLLEASRFLIVNGDTLSGIDPSALLVEHARSGALVTLALIPNPSPDRYGGVLVSDDGVVQGFVRRGTPGPSWHFVGLQAAEAEVFSGLSPDVPSESVGWLYPKLMAECPGSVRALRTNAEFLDIGTPADYLDTSLLFAARAAEGVEAARSAPPSAIIGQRCRVAASATVSRTVLWDDVVVGEGASVKDCVLADGVTIEAGSRFEGVALVRAEGRVPSPGERIHGHLLAAPIGRGPLTARGTSDT